MKVSAVKKILASIGLALAFFLTLPTSAAFAHAQLISVTPNNGSIIKDTPEAIIIEYSEPIKAVNAESIFVLDANAEQVPGTNYTINSNIITITLPQDLKQGGYVAVWKVVSSDGHIVGSASAFAYGEFIPPDLDSLSIPSSAATPLFDPLKIVFNILLFFSTAVVFTSGVRALIILRYAAAAATIVGVASITLLTINYGGFSQSIALGETQAALIKSLAAALLLAASLFHKLRSILGGLGLAGIAGSAFVYGHANGLENNPLLPFFFATHLLAATVWTAGVIALVLDPNLEKAKQFGKWAIPSIIVLAISAFTTAFTLGWNPFNAWTWDNLLTIKVLAVALALMLGLTHHLIVRRKTNVSSRKLRTGFVLESVLILLVAGGSTSLSATPAPAFASSNQTYQNIGVANEIYLADGTPIMFYLSDVSSSTILTVQIVTEKPAEQVEIFLSHEESAIKDLPAILNKSNNGTEFTNEIIWAFPGQWKVNIKVVEDQFTVKLGELDVYVSAPSSEHQH